MKKSSSFVKKLREKLNCTQNELAQILGVTSATISRWENNNAKPHKEKWELMHDLNDALSNDVEARQLKKKLLIAAGVELKDSPIETFQSGNLDQNLRSSLNEDELFEQFFLESGLDSDKLLEKKFDYWKKLLNRGEIPIQKIDAWNELASYYVPISKLVRFLAGSTVFMPDKSHVRFSEDVYWIDRPRSIKREPLTYLKHSEARIEGFAVVLMQIVISLRKLLQDAEEMDRVDPEEQWESVERFWNLVNPEKDDMRLDALLPRIEELCRDVLENVDFEFLLPEEKEFLYS